MELKCEHCKGLGYTIETNIMKARKERIPCKQCRGTGKIQEEKPDGKVFFIQKCEVGFWQELRAGKPVATLHIHICPIINPETNKPLFKHDQMYPQRGIPRIFLEIVQMNTKPKYRKQGIMGSLLDSAMADPKIEWVETSWDDSTADGRNFLLGKGFEQKGSKLIYRKNNPVVGV